MKIEKTRKTELIAAGIFFTGVFVFFHFFYAYHLYFIEQLQIFLFTPAHFLSYFSRPSILSSCIGDFLTQFYYLSGGGPVVISLTLMLLWLLVRRFPMLYSGPDKACLWSLIPSVFSWIALCDPEFPLAAVIGLIIAITSFLLYVSIGRETFRKMAGILMIPVLYTAAGSAYLLFAVLAVWYEFTVRGKKRVLPFAGMVILISVLVPPLMRQLYNITLLQSYTWIDEITRHVRFTNYLPILSVPLTILVLTISSERFSRFRGENVSIAAASFAIACILSAGLLLNAGFTREKILKLDYKASANRWEDIYELSRKYRLRNNIATYYTNMSLARLGLMPEKLMDFYQPAATGLFIPVNASENYLTITFSNEVYWQLGDVNAAQHSALLGMIFSPRARSSRLMKRLAEINIVNGEYEVAEKYLGILGKTLFHRKWAESRRKFPGSEEECAQTPWIASKRLLIPSEDVLKAGNEYRKTLEMLIESNPSNRMALDYLLCYDLLIKDIETFRADIMKYLPGDNPLTPGKVYQETLLISIVSGRDSRENYHNYVFDPAILKRIADYTGEYEETGGDGGKLIDRYADTYWFYYHFAEMKQTE
ncbi:MAG TPA: DUF6057 family protein [Bacteroidales bacterium]|nr:DUF6057 family protein [Bacteroidales bacterium]